MRIEFQVSIVRLSFLYFITDIKITWINPCSFIYIFIYFILEKLCRWKGNNNQNFFQTLKGQESKIFDTKTICIFKLPWKLQNIEKLQTIFGKLVQIQTVTSYVKAIVLVISWHFDIWYLLLVFYIAFKLSCTLDFGPSAQVFFSRLVSMPNGLFNNISPESTHLPEIEKTIFLCCLLFHQIDSIVSTFYSIKGQY